MKLLLGLLVMCTAGTAFASSNDVQQDSAVYVTSDPNSEAMAIWTENGDSALVQLVAYQGGAPVLAVNDSMAGGSWAPCTSNEISTTPRPGWKPLRSGNYLNPRYIHRLSKMGVACMRVN